jgi:cytochrome c2
MRIEGFNEAWNGDLLASSLAGQSLFRIRAQGDHIVYAERIEIGTRIRAIHQHTDGRIALLTDDYRIIFLSPAERQGEEIFVSRFIDNLRGPVRDRVTQAIDTCSQCHSFVAGDHQNAPSLGRVYGSAIASTTFAGYSDALRSRGGRWNREALLAFIADPQGFAPGTNMPNPEINDPQVREEVVNLLQGMRESY